MEGPAKSRTTFWLRIGCVALAMTALALILRRVRVAAIAEAFMTMRVGWFVTAILLYGLMFVAASWRWHLMLRLTDSAVHFGATFRFSLIGHFFYNILFGAAGGDVAKSALYARWHALPLPNVLAAASLDRLLGMCGLLVFAAVALGIAWAKGGFAVFTTASIHWPVRWLALVAVAGVVLLLVLRRAGRDSLLGRFVAAFLGAARRLAGSWRTAAAGVCSGVMVQLALSGVLALNLHAVSRAPVPWLQLVWVFPAISIISGLPVSVAGLGVRDGAALVLLGLFGISGPHAVAASLLTASASLFWMGASGVLLWYELGQEQHRTAAVSSPAPGPPR